MKLARILAAVVVGSSLVAPAAQAGTILDPGTVIANSMGEFGPSFNVNRLRDQSGLSANYISGVTDFATFVATTTHTGNPDSNGWLSSGPNVLPGHIDFDLGVATGITGLALWNHAFGSTANVQRFEVYTSNVPDFSSSTFVGAFVNPQGVGGGTYPATVFDIGTVDARYWRIAVQSYYGNTCCVAIGELALDTETAPPPVPEPGTLSLFGVAAVALGRVLRRKRN